MLVTIQNECLLLRVETLGAEMMELQSMSGMQYLWDGDKKYWSGRAPVLFPYVGRLTENQYTLNGQTYPMTIHGFAKKSVFSVEEQTEKAATFCLRETPETLREYPFRFVFRVRYALSGSTVLVTYSVRNGDEREMPFGIGGHPGFRVPLVEGTGFEDYELQFLQPCQPDRIGFTEERFLSGQDARYSLENGTTIRLRHELFDEDAVVLKNMARSVRLCSAKTDCAVTVSYPQMPYLGLWHMPHKDAPYVCIEPWTSLPSRMDVVEEWDCKSDLIHLQPGAEYENTWSITITENQPE